MNYSSYRIDEKKKCDKFKLGYNKSKLENLKGAYYINGKRLTTWALILVFPGRLELNTSATLHEIRELHLLHGFYL